MFIWFYTHFFFSLISTCLFLFLNLSKNRHILFSFTTPSLIDELKCLYKPRARSTTYHGIAVGHQVNSHDVTQHDPGWEEHQAEKLPAARTQALIVKPHLDWICCLMRPGEVGFKALLQNLQNWVWVVMEISFST